MMNMNDSFEMQAFVQNRRQMLAYQYTDAQYDRAQFLLYIGKAIRTVGNWLTNFGQGLQAQQSLSLKTVPISRSNQ